MAGPLSDQLPLVLVVDDHADSREFLVELLGAGGRFRAVAAESPAQAFQRLSVELPALIITDIAMPGIDGWTFIQQLRDHEPTSLTPIIVMTGHVGDHVRDTSLAAGATYFPKPIQIDELLAEVQYLVYSDHSRDRRSPQSRRDVGVPDE